MDAYPALTEDGKAITFCCTSAWGTGFASVVDGQVTTPPQHRCFLNGTECYAAERYMGGIGIEVSMRAYEQARR